MSQISVTVVIKIVVLVIGLAILSISSFGLGNNNPESKKDEYNTSLVFFILGLIITVGMAAFFVGESIVEFYADEAILAPVYIQAVEAPLPQVI